MAASSLFGKPMTYKEADYVLSNTPTFSKLNDFYKDFILQHFSNQTKLAGSIAEWDALLLKHFDLRILLLNNFRNPSLVKTRVRPIRDYSEPDFVELIPPAMSELPTSPLPRSSNSKCKGRNPGQERNNATQHAASVTGQSELSTIVGAGGAEETSPSGATESAERSERLQSPAGSGSDGGTQQPRPLVLLGADGKEAGSSSTS
ncbi:hypothetical protein IL306_014441 [Fusarium sp. DS 682]|nr:hypothetical protein IL306_014441 [Fusarium sp. DS 682]